MLCDRSTICRESVTPTESDILHFVQTFRAVNSPPHFSLIWFFVCEKWHVKRRYFGLLPFPPLFLPFSLNSSSWLELVMWNYLLANDILCRFKTPSLITCRCRDKTSKRCPLIMNNIWHEINFSFLPKWELCSFVLLISSTLDSKFDLLSFRFSLKEFFPIASSTAQLHTSRANANSFPIWNELPIEAELLF